MHKNGKTSINKIYKRRKRTFKILNKFLNSNGPIWIGHRNDKIKLRNKMRRLCAQLAIWKTKNLPFKPPSTQLIVRLTCSRSNYRMIASWLRCASKKTFCTWQSMQRQLRSKISNCTPRWTKWSELMSMLESILKEMRLSCASKNTTRLKWLDLSVRLNSLEARRPSRS